MIKKKQKNENKSKIDKNKTMLRLTGIQNINQKLQVLLRWLQR